MKIVFLTNKLPHGAVLLRHLTNAGITIDAIVLEDTPPESYVKQIKGYQKKLGWPDTVRVVSKMGYRRYITNRHLTKAKFYANYADEVLSVPHFNRTECEALLTDLAPDIIVLGGARIIRSNILAKARVCVLNAHPGLLPEYRGVDPTPWAVENGDPIGATVHVVDPGVDTGAIIERQELPITPGAGLDELEQQLTELCGELMARAVSRIISTGAIEGRPQVAAEGRQYYRMPRKHYREIDRRLKAAR